MLKHSLALLMFTGLVGASCVGNDGGPGDGGGDDTGPEWTDGVSTLSGHADAGFIDGPRGDARFANPVGVLVVDKKLYVADFDNGKVREINLDTYVTTTVVSQQDFSRPFAFAHCGGTLFVATDRKPDERVQTNTSGTIWRIDLGAKRATPVAVGIGRPRGLACINSQIAFADYQNHVVGLVNPSSGAVTTLAGRRGVSGMQDGSGEGALFFAPYGIVARGSELIVADYDNHRLRRVGLDGAVATIAGVGTAGFADGAMNAAKFNRPQAMTIDSAGTIYITDTDNFRIRRITGTSVETIAGGSAGFQDHDDRLQSKFFGLEGISVSADGSWAYVADGNRGEAAPYNRVRAIKLK